MTSPIDYAENILDRAQRLVDMVGTARPAPGSADADLLRSSWTFTGAAVDTYFHERIRRSILSNGLSAKGKKLEIPLGEIDSILDAVVKNRQTNTRPRVSLKRAIQEQLGFQTFQGHRNIERAFGLIGVTSYWPTISGALTPPQTVPQVKNRLDRQYRRRNQITHEGDLQRQERPRVLKHEPIARLDVQHEIDWTRSFLVAADLAV